MRLPSVPSAAAATAAAALFAIGATGQALALRAMSTDRPDRTESPYSVDGGHVQLELDAVNLTRDREDEARSQALAVGVANLKIGLDARSDLQLVVAGWGEERLQLGGAPEAVSSGPGDLAVRLKHNLVGNDGGPVAVAAMPFVQAPLREEFDFDRLEAGLIVPVAWSGPWALGFGAMAELDLRRDESGQGHHAEYVLSATTSRELVGSLAGFVEVVSVSRADAGVPWSGTFDAGLTLGVGENLQLDTGFNVGLARETDDLALFVGLSVRR